MLWIFPCATITVAWFILKVLPDEEWSTMELSEVACGALLCGALCWPLILPGIPLYLFMYGFKKLDEVEELERRRRRR